jgi:ankyrin repeat protein
MDLETLDLLWCGGVGIDINEPKKAKTLLWTMINWAARTKCFVAISTFVDHEGTTPLHAAAKLGYLSRVQWLLDRGAIFSLNSRTVTGHSPLDFAMVHGPHPQVEAALSALLEVGQTIHVRNPYPVYVMRLADVLALDKWAGHEELLHQGKIIRYNAATMKTVIFVSQEWTSIDHPDHTRLRLTTLQGVLRRMRSGLMPRVGAPAGLRLAASNTLSSISTQQFSELTQDAVIWYSHISLPKRGVELDGRQRELERVIACIFESVSMMLCICAPVVHRERGDVRNLLTWQQQGQSRLEILATLLQTRTRNLPVLVCEGPGLRPTMYSETWIVASPVGLGDHPCCESNHEIVHADGSKGTCVCDKDIMASLLHVMIKHRSTYHLHRDELTEYRMWSSVLHVLYKGLPEQAPAVSSTRRSVLFPSVSLDDVLFTYRFNGVNDSGEQGDSVSPLLCASCAGNVNVVRSLLKSGADANRVYSGKQLPALGLIPGVTPLWLACGAASSYLVIRELLEHGADPSLATGPNLVTVLSAAAAASSPEGIRALKCACTELQIPLDVEKGVERYGIGASPLLTAAYMSTPETVRALVDIGCDRGAIADTGYTVFRSACENPRMDVETLALLWQNGEGVDVNAQAHPKTAVWQALMVASEVGLMVPGFQRQARAFGEIRGSTPLHAAARFGHLDLVSWLLANGAARSLSLRTASGMTPFALARRNQHYAVANLLEEATQAESRGEAHHTASVTHDLTA